MFLIENSSADTGLEEGFPHDHNYGTFPPQFHMGFTAKAIID
jgi:hypothetical protein